MLVQWGKEIAALLQVADPIKTHGVEAFKDIKILPVLGRLAMLLCKSRDFLKTCDDAFFAWCAAELLLDF